MADCSKLVPFILKWEGGFVCDPVDRGGATNKGVTLSTFKQVFGSDKTVEDLKQMTDNQFNLVLKRFYWDRWHGDKINNQSIANIVVDWVWASGKWGIIKVQELLGLQKDGIVGNLTLQKINNYPDKKELFDKIQEARRVFIGNIILLHPEQKKFEKGWLNRINDLKFTE